MVELRIYKVVSSIFFKLVICQSSVLVDIPIRAMTDVMGTMFECLHCALKDNNVGSVNTDIGAEFYSVGLNPRLPA